MYTCKRKIYINIQVNVTLTYRSRSILAQPTYQTRRLDARKNAGQKHTSRVLRKLGLMHVRKVSSQISLCSPHRLIKNDTFRFNGNLSFKKISAFRKSSLGGKCLPWLACAAQAYLGWHFTHIHLAHFSQNTTHTFDETLWSQLGHRKADARLPHN